MPTPEPPRGLSPEQDAELRRLSFLAQLARLSRNFATRVRELRGQDRRAAVRPPRPEDVQLRPGRD